MMSFIPADFRAIHVHGQDAVAFIQSQVTLDLESIQSRHFYPAAWCDAKGRALFVMLIARRQDHVMIVLPASQAAAILKRMTMFSIGRKVKISDSQHFRARIHKKAIESKNEWSVLNYDARRAICMRPIEDDEQPSHENHAVLDQQWLATDLAHGFPWLSTDTSGQFIPQMLGLEALDGLSYHKGCYPGQEVIARVHYRGKVTRKTMHFEVSGSPVIRPAEEFKLDNQKAVVLYAMNSLPQTTSEPDGACTLGLAVAPAAVEPGQTFSWNSLQGHMVTR